MTALCRFLPSKGCSANVSFSKIPPERPSASGASLPSGDFNIAFKEVAGIDASLQPHNP
jgi:hypothetical protein